VVVLVHHWEMLQLETQADQVADQPAVSLVTIPLAVLVIRQRQVHHKETMVVLDLAQPHNHNAAQEAAVELVGQVVTHQTTPVEMAVPVLTRIQHGPQQQEQALAVFMQVAAQVQEQTKERPQPEEQHPHQLRLLIPVAVVPEVQVQLITTEHQALSLFVTPILFQQQLQQRDHQQQQHPAGIVITHGQVVGV
jgi:acyl-CoA hydrolase